MTEAFEIVKRIKNQEVFDSAYTKKPANENSIMSVKEEQLFEAMSQEEKLELSDDPEGRPVLNIWYCQWVYIPIWNEWLKINSKNVRQSLVFTKDGKGMFDIDTFAIYEITPIKE